MLLEPQVQKNEHEINLTILGAASSSIESRTCESVNISFLIQALSQFFQHMTSPVRPVQLALGDGLVEIRECRS